MIVIAHVSQPYVTVGRMTDLCICSLLAALRSLLFRSFLLLIYVMSQLIYFYSPLPANLLHNNLFQISANSSQYVYWHHIYSREAFADSSQSVSSAFGEKIKISRRWHLQGKLIWGSLGGLVAGLTSTTRNSQRRTERNQVIWGPDGVELMKPVCDLERARLGNTLVPDSESYI